MNTTKPKIGANRGNAGKGRPKGAKNKTTTIAKEAIAQVADNLGGAARLTAWAQENADNEKAFWVSIYPKLLPLQVTGENGGPVQIQKVENVIIDPSHPGS
jgi:hypothetical protein